jgi:hypothetical protein
MMNQPAAGPSSDCHHTQMVAPAVSHDDYVDKGMCAVHLVSYMSADPPQVLPR